MRAWIAITAVVTLAILGRTANAQNGAATIPVETAKAGRTVVGKELNLTANIVANAEVRVFAKIPGRVKELRVEEGQRVTKGAILAVIDEIATMELAARQAEIALGAAQVQLEQARKYSRIRWESQLAGAKAGVTRAVAVLNQVRDLSGPRVRTQVAQAEAGLDALRATLKKIREGAREQEREQVRAMLRQADAALGNATSNYERMKALYAEGAVSRQTFEGVETQFKVAQAQRAAAEEQVKLVEEGARPEDIEAVEAQIAQADAMLGLARLQAETRSWEQDIAQAESGVAAAEAAVKTVQASVDGEAWNDEIRLAESQVNGASVAALLAKQRVQDCIVTAPISGVVVARFVDEGGYAVSGGPVGDPLLTLMDTSVVYADAEVSESDLPNVRKGMSARVDIRAANVTLTGRVTRVGATVDPRKRTTTLRVELRDAGPDVKPGMYATVSANIGDRAEAVTVPRLSVLEMNGDKGVVYVVVNGRAAKRNVLLGGSYGDRIAVVNGVSEGDEIIVGGQTRVKDGSPVRVTSAS
jgi:RND family efflux transporter MFP subunit